MGENTSQKSEPVAIADSTSEQQRQGVKHQGTDARDPPSQHATAGLSMG